MATQAIAGRKATLAVMAASSAATTTLLAECKSFKLTVTEDSIDATSNDSSGWKEVIPGRRGWKLDVQAIDAFTDAEQAGLRKALSSGTTRYVVLTPATAKTQKFKGWVNVTGYEIDIKENDAILANFSAEGVRSLKVTS